MNSLNGNNVNPYSFHSTGSSIEDEDEKRDLNGSGSKRQRVHFSCTECHRRKQKCNRETPCQHCIARKIPDRCKTFQPGEDPTDLGSRVNRLEQTVQDNFERLFEMMQQQQQEPPARPHAAPVASQQPLASSSSGQIMAEGAGSEAGDEVLDRERSPIGHQYDTPKHMSMKIDSLLDTLSGTQGTGALTDPVRSIECATDLDVLTQEYGMTESITGSLMATFPSRKICDVLVDHFFLEINWLRQPLSEKIFRKLFETFWASGPTLTANNVNTYAVLVIAMAIARCSVNRPDVFTEEPRAVRLMARQLFFAGRKALLVSTMLGREDIHQVMGYSIASRFLLLDRRITEAWTCVANAVKTAHSIGLHRDGSKLRLSQEESEMRRRVWSAIYFTDRNLCMNLGRPTQIDDNVVDTQLPSEVDEHDTFPEMFKPVATTIIPKGTPPSPLSYTRHRHRLAVIMGKIISTYQNLHTPAHYSDIVMIDKELEQYRKTVPTTFHSEINSSGQLYHVDTTWDERLPFVAIHRYLLESEIDHIRVSLHRPYLLRTNHKTGHRYEYSRRACIAAAHHNILLRKDIISALKKKYGEEHVPKALHLHLGTYKTLNSLIIIGMYLIVTPEAEDAEMLLDHLRFYVTIWKKKKESQKYVRDDMKEREASIIYIFLQRIEETMAEAAKKKKNNSSSSSTRKIKREAETEYTREGKRGKRADSAVKAGQGSRKLTEEDTAGVLLDLNQSGREAASLPYNEYVATFSGRGGGEDSNRKSSGEILPPWPYLPMNTHHQYMPSQPSSLSNGSAPSPNDTPISAEDVNNATSAQQLFESWFRYNAFDTMDFDTLASSQDGMPATQPSSSFYNPHQAQPQNMQTTTSFLGKGGGAVYANSPAQSPLQQQNSVSKSVESAAPMPSSQHSGSRVQLSALPAPIWNATSNVQGQANQGDGMAGASNATFGAGAKDLTSTMTNSNIVPTLAGQLAGAGGPRAMAMNGDPFNDASFDPNFWQKLIDKIAS
ncbi:hypothetical protein CBS101457_005706 [Exobasidium rhododendri]|nr:hypothetical protein CBS101457_005706 [Exobasidium rhododendri]